MFHPPVMGSFPATTTTTPQPLQLSFSGSPMPLQFNFGQSSNTNNAGFTNNVPTQGVPSYGSPSTPTALNLFSLGNGTGLCMKSGEGASGQLKVENSLGTSPPFQFQFPMPSIPSFSHNINGTFPPTPNCFNLSPFQSASTPSTTTNYNTTNDNNISTNSVSPPVGENQLGKTESPEIILAHPVYSEDTLIGLIITPSKVVEFLAQVKNFDPSKKFQENEQRRDVKMNELVTAVSHYCWENDKCLSPTNHCGFFIFDNFSSNPNMPKSYKTLRKSNRSKTTRFQHPGFNLNTFESISKLLRYNRIHRIPPFTDLSSFHSDSGEPAQIRQSKRWKSSSHGYSSGSGSGYNYEGEENNNYSHNFIFKPKILTFLEPSSSDSASFSRFHQLFHKKASTNFLKSTFPPSIRQDFLRLQTRLGNYPSNSGQPVGNLPYSGQALISSSNSHNNTSCSLTVNLQNGQNPVSSLSQRDQRNRTPLNYDDYLKRYAEEKNNLRESLYWNYRWRKEREFESRNNIMVQQFPLCHGTNRRLSGPINSRNFSSQLQLDSSNNNNNNSNNTDSTPVDTTNYYKLKEDTERIRLELIHQSLHHFERNSSKLVNSKNKETAQASALENTRRKRKGTTGTPREEEQEREVYKNMQNGDNGDRCLNDNVKITPDTDLESISRENENRTDACVNKINGRTMEYLMRKSKSAGDNISPNHSNPNSNCLPTSMTGNKKDQSCRVALTKPHYYCSPSISDLNSRVCSTSGSCLVKEFRVGHEDFGHVTFHGEIDVAGLNLDEIVDIKLKQFTLYPNEQEDKRIPHGQGLKRPATVTLFNVWPMDKTKTIYIKNVEEIKAMNYEHILRKSCKRTNSTFVSYQPELGHWTFKIP